jgi:hypothetical protein
MSELGGVIILTNFQGLWITLLNLWITPQVCGLWTAADMSTLKARDHEHSLAYEIRKIRFYCSPANLYQFS